MNFVFAFASCSFQIKIGVLMGRHSHFDIVCVCVFFLCFSFNDLRRNIFQSSVCMCTSAVHPLCFPPLFHL